ncbi:MAG: AAA family ATPase [Desulfobacterales bacterium]|nr:AAA family ATPase [Desulfobacterales bacterium]
MTINKYDPRKKKYGELAETFICGENILKEILEDLEADRKGKTTRQSWIITGPRGAGKSHLITLLYREIVKSKKLFPYWRPLIFPEEIFKIDSLYRLLLAVLENFFRNVEDSERMVEYESHFYELKKTRLKGNQKRKREQKQALAKELLDLLLSAREASGKKIILMLENLQYLLRDQIPEDDQKLLRGFLNENPQVFIIVGTALTVFNEIENYGRPFYHFFRVRSMEALGKKGLVKFLQKVAAFQNHAGIDQKIENNRHYIYTYNILTGGNPRLVLFLYELLLDNEELNTEIILEKVSELTPYFLDKTRDESRQRKLILDALATGAPAQTATEIAGYINEDQKSITEQLKRLSAEGWTREIPLLAEGIKQKEVFYTLRDYFYRIWYQARMGDIDESEVYCLAELAALLFDKKEIEDRLNRHKDLSTYQQQIYEKAHELAGTEDFTANIKLMIESSEKSENKEIQKILDDIDRNKLNRNWKKLLESAEQLLDFPSEKYLSYSWSAYAYHELKDHKKAIKCCRKAVEIKPDMHEAWYNMGNSYYHLNDYGNFYRAFIKYIKHTPVFDLLDFSGFYRLTDTARSIFSSTEELQNLLAEDSSMEIKLESLGKLLLLGKFVALSDSFEEILKSDNLPADGTKMLDFFLEGYILDLLKKGQDNGELTALFKSWILLNARIWANEESKLRKKFLEFILFYIQIAGKEKISLEIIQHTMDDLFAEGIEVSDIVLNILGAIKEPNTRNAQKWMADPLFKEIVTMLSN